MILSLQRTADESVLMTFVRDDGSTTARSVSPLFVHHELMHYAVESALKLDRGLFGLIASGRGAEDFDAAARNWLPLEAHHAEVIVGALEAEAYQSAHAADFAENVRAICNDVGVPVPPEIEPDRLDAIRARFESLAREWSSLRPGETLDLPWP
jgi:hypothetical protein